MMDLRAALESPFAAPIRFSLNPNDPTDTAKVYQTAQSMVNTLRNVENCDIVICLSHAGTNADDSKSEDAGLAYNVQGIDVIISGHTHTVLSEPKIVSYKDSTSFSIICSAGAYCNYLGNLHIRKGASGVTVVSYRLTPINPTVARDENIYSRILEFKAMASAGYLQLFGGIGFDDVVAKAPFTFDNIEDFWNNPKPSSLGDIVADSFDYAIRVAEGSTYNTINAAAQADGIVRNTVNMGNMTVEDTFQVLSMGISPCPYIPVPPYNINTPGLPLMAFYLYGAELKTVLEINTTIAPAFTAANMYISRAKCTWDSTRPAFDRITSLQVTNASGQLEDYNPTTLYRVAADYYAMVMMVQLLSTYGITIQPRNAFGIPVSDYSTLAVRFTSGPLTGAELKEWFGFYLYLSSFPKGGDNIPVIPDAYRTADLTRIVKTR
jgi:2',3'-cyclic-nucleotide 2'-phosphodiesterase (5'-nucleotidase family)